MRPRTSRALSRAVFAPVFAALVGAASLFVAMPARADRVESPLELMYADDAMIVAGKLIETNPAGRIVIARRKSSGERASRRKNSISGSRRTSLTM